MILRLELILFLKDMNYPGRGVLQLYPQLLSVRLEIMDRLLNYHTFLLNYLYHLLFSDAEIYEVHPETRLRITAEEHKPSPHTTPEITTGSEYSAGFDDETTLPSDFVETTTELFHETTYQTGE